MDTAEITEMFARYGFGLTAEQLGRFERLTAFMLDYNTKVNLTRITDRRDIYIKHYLDSLLLLSAVELPRGASVIDVGSGAGFPALPLAIMREDLAVTALDATKKKCDYIRLAGEHIGVNVTVVWGRAEEVTTRYDYAVARAVAPLPKLYRWCRGLAPVFVALKGYGDTFAAEYAGYAAEFGTAAVSTREFVLPGGGGRNVVVVGRTGV